MHREITTLSQGDGSDQLLHRGLYVSTNELLRVYDNWLAGMMVLKYFGADIECE